MAAAASGLPLSLCCNVPLVKEGPFMRLYQIRSEHFLKEFQIRDLKLELFFPVSGSSYLGGGESLSPSSSSSSLSGPRITSHDQGSITITVTVL